MTAITDSHEAPTSARELHAAMTDLRHGRITSYEFRSIMRASREHNGQARHDRLKAEAIAATNR